MIGPEKFDIPEKGNILLKRNIFWRNWSWFSPWTKANNGSLTYVKRTARGTVKTYEIYDLKSFPSKNPIICVPIIKADHLIIISQIPRNTYKKSVFCILNNITIIGNISKVKERLIVVINFTNIKCCGWNSIWKHKH